MQRTERVALGAGATLGLGGGMLGAFVACTLGQAVAYHVLEQFSDLYIDLGPPAGLAARPAEPVSDQDLPHLPPATSAERGAHPQPTGTPALTAREGRGKERRHHGSSPRAARSALSALPRPRP